MFSADIPYGYRVSPSLRLCEYILHPQIVIQNSINTYIFFYTILINALDKYIITLLYVLYLLHFQLTR